jgi:eukaryotic-like serine/threonine-protein kinase
MAIRPPFLDPIENAVPGLAIVGPVRAGGQKSVWRAAFNGQTYALKILSFNAEAAERAKREISIMQTCACPQIVRFGPLDLQEIEIANEKYIYYLEEFIDGVPLDVLPKPVSFVLCRLLGLQICEAIDHLWKMRKIHRDIKPGNIMQRTGQDNFVLLDICLALDLEGSTLTATGGVVGTPLYLSPDQLKLVNSRRDLDFRSDLHALGVVMYECLTGVHPLWNSRVPQMNILGNILTLRPLPLRDFRADTPAALEEIVLRLLEKEPNLRFARLRHLVEELEGVDLP